MLPLSTASASRWGGAFRCLLAAVVLCALPVSALATPCEVPDTGTGTVYLPPPSPPCGYTSPDDLHLIIAGLPPGTTIEVGVEHERFFGNTSTPGGSLGGEVEQFQSFLTLHLTGTGTLAGFSRDISMLAQCETHVGPRTPGATTQSFPTDMFMLHGELPPGDPDFDLLRITAGTGFGMPSPGHTTLTRLPNGNWNVDSFFDITYRIDFIGAPGSPLAGMSGSTTDGVPMQTGEEPAPDPCIVLDNGSGTVNLPPPGCPYLSPEQVHMIINGLPPGTTINVGAQHAQFFNVITNPGGPLGGETEQFSSFLKLEMHGTGGLSLNRTIMLPLQCMVATGPRTPGASPQSFDTEMMGAMGAITGDPDFDLLRITAGTSFGMPSPGHTTLTRLGSGNWNVDSFFDITYRIDFIGAQGGPLGGHSGSTTGTIRMQAGVTAPMDLCVQPDESGTVKLPPIGCGYLSPDDVHMIIDGLPPGTTVELGPEHAFFFNTSTSSNPGTPGQTETFDSILDLHLTGTGDLAGFNKKITLEIACESWTGPASGGGTVSQSFPTEMRKLSGEIATGDPDFDLLRVRGGTDFGMPSPGHTTLTQLPSTEWAVDSFFDIFYEIEFAGSPGGPLSGRSGSTTGTIRMMTGSPVTSVPSNGPHNRGDFLVLSPNPARLGASDVSFVIEQAGRVSVNIYNVRGQLVRNLVDQALDAGRHEFRWDGLDQSGQPVRSGTYFYELRQDGKKIGSQKAVLMH